MAEVAPCLLLTRLTSKGIENYWSADMANTKLYYLILKHNFLAVKSIQEKNKKSKYFTSSWCA